MKAGKVVVNMDLTPTQQSIKRLQKTFKGLGDLMFKPFKSFGKALNSNVFAGVGNKAVSGFTNQVKKALMEPIESVKMLLDKQAELQGRGQTLGLSQTRQVNLDKYFSDLGVGKSTSQNIQSSFGQALQSGKLAGLQSTGAVSKTGDVATKLQSFIKYLSTQSKDNQSVVAQNVLGTQSANALFESRSFLGEDAFQKSAGKGVGAGNTAIDKQAFLIQRARIQAEQQRENLLGKTTTKTGVVKDAEGLETEKLKNRLGALSNEDVIKQTTESLKKLDDGIAEMNKGIQKLVGLGTDALKWLAGYFHFGKGEKPNS